MTIEEKRDFKNSLRRILGRYYTLVGAVLFLLGIALRLFSIGKTSFTWQVFGDIGTFLGHPATWVWVLKSKIKDFRQADLMVTNPSFHAWSDRNCNPILTARFTEC